MRSKLLLMIMLLPLWACDQGAVGGGGGGGEMKVEHLVVGTGLQPKATDTVEVHYHGTLEDGTVFDSSVERGQPAKFPLTRVISCWTRGIPEMKVGGKAVLTCPANTAYGAQAKGRIPANSTLIFEVELLGVH
jgi:FKBP-type peptidyl-prolyl cis-trans isomerase FkpA